MPAVMHSGADLATLLDVAPDAMVVIDRTGRIVVANAHAERLFGHSRDELVGQPVEVLVPERHRGAHPAHRAAYFAEPVARLMREGLELFGRRRDGAEFPAEITLSPLNLGGETVAVAAIRDITARRKAEAKFRALLESAPDAMVIVEPRGGIVLVNAQAERLFGYSRDDLIGQPVELLIPERYRGAHGRHRGAYAGHPTVRPMGAGLELYGRRRDGSEFPVEISLSPLDTEDGPLVASAIRDISERKRAEAERASLIREQAARVEAEATGRLKDEFLVTLSHELRTPLNAILGWTVLLRNGGIAPDTAARALATIERNARHQVQLIEDLLDLSRIITGKLRLEVRSVDLARVLEAAIDVVRPAAMAKNIAISSMLEPATAPVAGDPDRLQQVVWNLLSNAVKFTPAGGRIDVRLERVGTSARITVSDTGQGVTPQFLPYVFDRFRQADSSTTRAHGGLGLGLSIVKHLVELHGGTVDARSAGEGRGTTFLVTLPYQVVPFPRRADPAQMSSGERLGGARVLVVDDQPDERELFGTILERYGAEVMTAGSAADALAAVSEWRPDVIVSDIAMPDEDGYVLIQRVRQLSPTEGGETPAAAVTAHARVEDRDRALGAGFQMYVSKPIDPARLADAVAALVRR